MLTTVLKHLRQLLVERKTERQIRHHWIPDTLWATTLDQFPFLSYRDADQQAELRRLSSLFLASKEFMVSAQGLEVGLVLSDEIAVAVAAQACVPILALEGGLSWYDDFVGIVLQPDQVVARRQWIDEFTGLFHEQEEVISGEAMPGGPVMLSWADVRDAGQVAAVGYNVVIHEFVHVLDMHGGGADGVPRIRDPQLRQDWIRTLGSELKRLRRRVRRGEDTFLDPYACEGAEEFLPVASEAFFVAPHTLRSEHPALYEVFRRFYGQEPHRHAPTSEEATAPEAPDSQGRTNPLK